MPLTAVEMYALLRIALIILKKTVDATKICAFSTKTIESVVTESVSQQKNLATNVKKTQTVLEKAKFAVQEPTRVAYPKTVNAKMKFIVILRILSTLGCAVSLLDCVDL